LFAFCLVEGVPTVGASVWLLALAQRHLGRTFGPDARSLSPSAYAAFVVQGPVLVGLALALRHLGLPGDVKAVLVAGLGLVGSFAVGRLVTRTPAAPDSAGAGCCQAYDLRSRIRSISRRTRSSLT
jgi:hypothetical protein